MELLVRLLRAEEVTGTGAEWKEALLLAEEQHVLSYIAQQFSSPEFLASPETCKHIQSVKRDAAVTSFYWISELKGVLEAFDLGGVKAIPLKGPFLAQRVYPHVEMRMNRDLDVLVPKAELSAAEQVLKEQGFVPGAIDDYHRPWLRNTTTVELHHDVENRLAFDFHCDTAWLRAKQTTFHGQPCWILAPEDELLFLCLHAVRHRFERLSLIVDLMLAFQKLPATTESWRSRNEVANLAPLLALGSAMVSRLCPDFVIPTFVSPDQMHDADKVAQGLWECLLTEPGEPLDWKRIHDFFIELEPTRGGRLRRHMMHLRILCGRVIANDYEFAAKFGLHRRWQVMLVRPLRLLCERLPSVMHSSGSPARRSSSAIVSSPRGRMIGRAGL